MRLTAGSLSRKTTEKSGKRSGLWIQRNFEEFDPSAGNSLILRGNTWEIPGISREFVAGLT